MNEDTKIWEIGKLIFTTTGIFSGLVIGFFNLILNKQNLVYDLDIIAIFCVLIIISILISLISSILTIYFKNRIFLWISLFFFCSAIIFISIVYWYLIKNNAPTTPPILTNCIE